MTATPTVFSRGRENVDWVSRARDAGVKLDSLPSHIAIIMDGNGRWAKRQGLPREVGHRRGVEALRRTLRAAHGIGLQVLTLYSFSSENWKRSATEVSALMGLLRFFVQSDLADLKANDVHVTVIGERSGLDPEIARILRRAEEETAANTGFQLVIAFNYGARDEIVRGVKALCADVAAGRLDPQAITHEMISGVLDTRGLPDPDLLIRTSGEQRISNFLLWQSAYTEFVFQDTLWPDYRGEDLLAAIAAFQHRDRRFGGRPDVQGPANAAGAPAAPTETRSCTGALQDVTSTDHIPVHAGLKP